MIRDTLTVMWKEWRDMPFLRGGVKGGLVGQLIFIGVLGVFLPAQTGKEFVNSGMALFLAVWGPFVMTISLSADSFAGERERRTLETLLASRLSDRAILFGKIATIVGYAWGMTLVILLLGLATANIGYGHGKLLMYPLSVGLGGPLLGLFVSVLLCGLGVIASLKAATVRQAAQTMSLLFMAVIIIPILGMILPKEWLASLYGWLSKVGLGGAVAVLLGILLVANVIVLSIGSAKFRRARLILE
jgi:ABC-2 type transport system permease protein